MRICFLHSFGHLAARLPGQFLRFYSNVGVFVNSIVERLEVPLWQLLERTSRIWLSKDVIQLWLQHEVSLLEKILHGSQTQSALTSYLFADPRAFCEHLPVLQQLTSSEKFLLYLGLWWTHHLRREDRRALAAITSLK